MTAPTVTRHLILITQDVVNPKHDRRSMHGERAIEKIKTGQRLMVIVADMGTHEEVSIRDVAGTFLHIYSNDYVKAIRAVGTPVEPIGWTEWSALSGDDGAGINKRTLELLFQMQPDAVKAAHALAVRHYDDFED